MVESQLQTLPADEPFPADLPGAEQPWLSILPEFGWAPLNLPELWQYRDLLYTLVSRDLKLRYKQTALGVAWVILQPLLAAGIFSFVFGKVAKLPSGNLPYLVFSYAGLLGWNLFSGILTRISGSLVANSHLIAKVFFPRLILPLSSVGSVLVDFAVAAAMMAGLMIVYHIVPTMMLVLLPIWMAVLMAMALGAGLISAAQANNPVLRQTGMIWTVPADTYPALRQAGVILLRSPHQDQARAFRSYLTGAEGQAILARHGFKKP